ncbi:MAG: ATP-binding protein [Candidatus Binatia bacterium]
MVKTLRVLIVEDQEDDCFLMLRELKREGLVVDWKRVATEEEYRQSLSSEVGLILADYSLPQFDAIRALAVTQELGLDIPFIIVSGTISEDVAVECMKRGASDYLIKDRMMRLGPAISHALHAKRLREEKRQAEEALRESELRFALAIRGANDGLWDVKFTTEYPFLALETPAYYSPRFKALLEYEESEFGNQLRCWFDRVHPQDRDFVQQALMVHLQEGVPYNVEYRLCTKSKKYLWVNGSGQALWDEEGRPLRMAGAIRDISERKRVTEALRKAHDELEVRVRERTEELAQANRALRESEQRYRSLVRNFPNGMVALFDHELRYTLAEGAGLEQLGFSKEYLEGKTIAEVWPTETCQIIEEKYRAALAGRETVTEISHNHRVHVLYALPLSDTCGKPYAGMMMTQDITARTEVERLKEEVVGIVSHELRTPLTSLRGFSELLLNKKFSVEQQRKFLTIIQQESMRLANLINDFLDLRRMESSYQVLHCAKVNIGRLIRERVSMLPPSEEKYTVRMILPEPGICVWADEERIHQVLANLLSNALKYMPGGGKIEIGARRESHDVIVWVNDQGIGIPPDAIAKLFNKFFRVDQPLSKNIRGTGLGLALVKEIIMAHHGRVWVESELGKGSTFFFSLPGS